MFGGETGKSVHPLLQKSNGWTWKFVPGLLVGALLHMWFQQAQAKDTKVRLHDSRKSSKLSSQAVQSSNYTCLRRSGIASVTLAIDSEHGLAHRYQGTQARKVSELHIPDCACEFAAITRSELRSTRFAPNFRRTHAPLRRYQ